MTIQIDERLRDKIQKYQYEMDSRKELIAFIISTNFSGPSEILERYEQEYLEFYKLYTVAKNEMSEIYLKDIAYKTWNLDFNTATLNVVI